jgi:hypothetical protein
MRRAGLLLLALALTLTACAGGRRWDQAVCVLVDVSGTYADQKADVVRLLKRDVLPALEPGDSLLLIRIDGQSYEKGNLEALLTLDTRPSQANAQKLALAKRLDAFAADRSVAKHTDIRGAMMLGAEYLKELGSGSRVMLIFSDLEEDLPRGMRRELDPKELEGVEVMAVNVKRLARDGMDPEVFRDRLGEWQERTQASSARGWRNVQDATRLAEALADARES